jgi:hypothetical protein
MKEYINLFNYKKRRHSRIGNDGIIEYILKTINIKKGIFVEFGAWDGVWNSNCRGLFEQGWEGIFIEPNNKKFKNLQNNYKNHRDRILCINTKVELEGGKLFDDIVNPYLKGKNIDFCAIDIDGLDLEVFETFKKYMPTVICIEGGQALHPYRGREKSMILKKNVGQSLKVMVNVFESRGYKILCCYQDCFFVKKELFYLFNVSEDLLTLYFDGLRARPLLLSYIHKHTGKLGKNNPIADYILDRTNYNKYKFKNRKKWVNENIDSINKLIDKSEKKERKHGYSTK